MGDTFGDTYLKSMASVSLKIRKNPKGSCKIILNINYGRKKRFRYATNHNLVSYKHWDKRNSQVKIIDEEPNAEKINDDIANLVKKANKLIRYYEVNDILLNNQKIKKDLENAISGDRPASKQSNGLVDYFDWFMAYYQKNPRPRTGRPYTKGSLKGIKSTRELLFKFQKTYGYIEFKDVTLDFHTELLEDLQNKDYSDNYIGAVIKNIKTVMSDAFERDYHHNLDFKKSQFTKPKEDSVHIYLSEKEIEDIANKDLEEVFNDKKYFKSQKGKPTLDYFERCRDFFVIECCTALRVNDTLKLQKKNIKEISRNGKIRYAIEKMTSKTKQPVLIPINSTLKKVFEKYDWNFPKKVSDTKINKYIKIIGQATGIDELIEKPTKKDGKKIIEKIPKYNMISNHTGRRSFCTNAFKRNVPPAHIMPISGHKTERAFYTYIKSTSHDNYNSIVDHEFFQ